MEHSDQLMRMLAAIIVLGVGGQWLAWRLRIPAILLLLTIGCLAGSISGFINTLAAARFRELFGASNVLQLSRGEASSRLETTWQNRLTGRTLFNPRLTYEFMDSAQDQGAVIKATRFSEVFTLDAFHAHYGDRVYPLFLLDGARIQVLAADSKINPRAGQLVVSLILPETAESTSDVPAGRGSVSDSSVGR